MPPRPVRVYLDSQDFSGFAKRGTADHLGDAYDVLIQLKADGVAEFGYSYLHIHEVLKPVTGQYAAKDRLKGLLMKRLCEFNAFPWSRDLREHPHLSFPNRGVWLPESMRLDIMQRPIREIRRMMIGQNLKSHGANRRKRRRLLSNRAPEGVERKAVWDKDEYLESGLKLPDYLRTMRTAQDEAANRQFTLRAYCDPEHYGDVAARFAPVEEVWVHFRRQDAFFLADIEAALRRVRPQYAKARAELQDLETQQQAYSQAGVRTPKPLKEELRRVRENIKGLLAQGAHRYPFEHFQHFFRRCVEDGYEPTTNDHRDLLHLAYATEVDLIRVDGATNSRFQAYEPFKGKLVPNFRDLPERIAAKRAELAMAHEVAADL